MSFRSHSGTLAAGVILIFLGVAFLIESFYASNAWYRFVWHLFWRYWPVIPIYIGLKRAFAYFTWQEVPPQLNKAPSKE